MELPKNITQIGEVDKNCKVYVEDYVVSYIKQLNQEAENRVISVALFGRHQQEDGIDYHFIYGACRVNQLPKEVRHLSQAQMQEVERFRRKYFPELEFAGYRLLNGEMIEGFHICNQDICRYIAGYTCFYEKNDAMLAYMLDIRESAPSEHIDQEKYEQVKKRQEERRLASAKAEEKAGVQKGNVAEQAAEGTPAAAASHRRLVQFPSSEHLQRMRLAAVGVFALLCLFGVATFREDTSSFYYGENAQPVNGGVAQEAASKDTLVMEDKLEQALLDENQDLPQEDGLSPEGTAEQETAGDWNEAQDMRQALDSDEERDTTQVQDLGEEQDITQTQDLSQAQAKQTQESVEAQAKQTQEPVEAQTKQTQGSVEAQAKQTQESVEGQTKQTQEPGEAQTKQVQDMKQAQGSDEEEDLKKTQSVEVELSTKQAQPSEEGQNVKQAAVVPEAVAYVIQPGDTLIAISKRQYGTSSRVKDICSRNKITDPDDIKQGQVIMLPR